MYQVSNEINELIRSSSRRFSAKLVIGDKEISNIKSIKLSRNTIAGDSVGIGGTTSATATIIISKTEIEKNSETDIYTIIKDCSIPMAKMTVTDAVTVGDLTTLTLYDVMATKMERQYVSNLSYPAKDADVLDEICDSVGITFVNNLDSNKMIEAAPEGYTKREMIGFIAALHAKNAVINRAGNLEFKWFEETYEPDSEYFDEPSINSNAITVKSVQSVGTDNKKIQAGSGSTQIQISNPYTTVALLYEILEKVNGFTYTPISISMRLGDPCIDPWDIITYKGYKIPCMNLELEYDGGIKLNIKSLGKEKSEDNYDNKGPVTKQMERYYGDLVLMKEAMVDKLDVEVANITYATIAELVALDVKVKGKLSTDELEAEVAKLDHVTASELAAEQARILVLETTSLTSSSAIITDLQASVTKTNTLIFGSASGESIQTEFSNSVIAQLGDAQIKSAMIKEIDAAKITGLDLNTSKFTVHSENGRSIWKDNTISMFDEVSGKPRIQIGKDSNGDYNVYIFNADGNLMFDALGVTENGINRKIIRDDMVSDTAEIHAAKLDLKSLFEVINDDTSYTLKSSKIYLDDEKQTLDVSFKVLSSTVDGLQSIQSSQGTDISVIQGQISSKIWKQDITTAIDDIEIGGRNLVPGTSSDWTAISLGQYLTMVVDLDMVELCEKYNLKDGDVLTYSVYLKSDSGKTIAARWQKWNSQSDRKGEYSEEYITNGEGMSTVQVTIDSSYTNLQLLITNISTTITDVTTEYYKCVKLEKGNKATDWTVAPEDIDTNITALNTQYSSIDQTVNSISGTVASHDTQIQEKADAKAVTKISDNLTLMQADLDGFKTTVSNTYTTKTDFNNLEIGGRNLVINSSKYRKDSPYTRTSSAKDGISVTDMYMPCKNGETYTFQCCTDGIWGNHTTNGTATGWIDIVLLLQTEGQTGAQYARAQILTKAPELGLTGKQTWTYTVPDNDGKEYTQITFRFDIHSDGVTEHTVNWWDLKAERGNKATDWTPAPEDVDANIANVDAKFSSYSTTAEMLAKIDVKAGEITQAVSETYTTKTEFNNLEIGGKNYLTNSNFINGFAGWSNTSNRYTIDENKLFEGVKSVKISRTGVTSNQYSYLWQSHKEIVQPGDTFTTSAYYYTDDVDGIDGGTPRLYLDFYDANKNELEASSSYISLELENGKWARNSLTRVAPEGAVYVETYICRLSRNGTLWIAKPQLEKSSKATDWAPALEDIQVEATSAKSVATQTANMMNWLVESGTSSSDFTLTDRMAELTAQKIKLNGYLEVDGDMLVAGAITADKLATDAIKSRNYTEAIGTLNPLSGSKLDLSDGSFKSVNLKWDSTGYFTGTKGKIGDWHVSSKLYSSLSAYIPPTKKDLDRIKQYLLGQVTLTSDELEYYDLNNDGVVDAVDMTNVKRILIGVTRYEDYDGKIRSPLNIDINALDGSKTIKFTATNPLGEEIESYLGATQCYFPAINGGYIYGDILEGAEANISGPLTVNDKVEIHGNGLELYYTTPYIDFHYENNSGDHTARIIENKSGALTVHNSISNASDRRLKQDICSLDRRYLNALNLFKPTSYRFIKGSDNLNIGFIAQDVEKALIDSGITDLPLISTDDTGMYALDYNQVTALNTLGHIDHEKRIQQLENDLAIANAIIQSLILQSFV